MSGAEGFWQNLNKEALVVENLCVCVGRRYVDVVVCAVPQRP